MVDLPPRGGWGPDRGRPGSVFPEIYFYFLFCNSLTLNVLVLFMYHFGLLTIDKILIYNDLTSFASFFLKSNFAKKI